MKLKTPFRGVPDGEVYPVDYAPGDECPDELVAGARAMHALDEVDNREQGGERQSGSDTTPRTVPEIKAALDAASITYDPAAKKADLLALLPA